MQPGGRIGSTPREQLLAAVRSAVSGDSLLAPVLLRRLLDDFGRAGHRRTAVPGLEQLTPQEEEEVLRLLARGLSNAENAGSLF